MQLNEDKELIIADLDRFSFFRSFAEAIERLHSISNKKELLYSIYRYVWFNEQPTFSKSEMDLKEMAWLLIQPTLNASKNKSKNSKKNQD